MLVRISNDLILSGIPLDLMKTLKESLTLTNPEYVKALKYRGRSGRIAKYIKMFSGDKKGRLHCPRGFGLELHQLVKDAGEDIEYKDCRRELEPVDFVFKGELRNYQKQALNSFTQRSQGILEAGTGAGKTVMALALIAERKQPCLVIVHTKELLLQWVDRIHQFTGEMAGQVGNGKFDIQPLTVATIQTARNRLDELVPAFGHIVVDECHRTPASTFQEVVTCFDAKYLTGLSATPYRADGLDRMIKLTLGDVIHRVDPGLLRETGAILKPEIITVNTSFTFAGNPSNEYPLMMTALAEDWNRNNLIAECVASELEKEKGTLLLVADRTAHLFALADILLEQGIDVAVLTGKTPARERGTIVEDLNAGKIKVLASTASLIGEGFDCPGLSTLFLCSPIKSKGRLVQMVGRILRPADDKIPRLYDFIDGKVGVLEYSAGIRQRIYEEIV
ncbi:DEAD/DEAH box helicase [Maridesulfovibrio hydrothermalis]|uniref:Type III restriction protein res subunit n=1 Tax=Maridesulfovibrio hydrothermalis AM13 = DSM 14728 TaxID=1121451 RepID=L0RC54_9BACT|nr:DEAD/DEAH box helicase [Maridesulfovibrio hydrothermalis]CCO24358.1 Type III restriction protein res subunit [Maridesulfovibrio hydrothermalis AM13 = DSM 14728]